MLETSNNNDLPAIPGKRYFTIGEVSDLCDVKPHVLRYWEQEFPQLRPVKRRGNRRYYLREDVLVVRKIRELLYEHGYTIGGARQQFDTLLPKALQGRQQRESQVIHSKQFSKEVAKFIDTTSLEPSEILEKSSVDFAGLIEELEEVALILKASKTDVF